MIGSRTTGAKRATLMLEVQRQRQIQRERLRLREYEQVRSTGQWRTLLLAWLPGWVRWSIAVVAVVMPVLAFSHGYEFKQEIKRRWSHWDVARATPMLEDTNHAQEGVHLLVRALVRTPQEPEVIRALAEVTAQAGLPHHARFFYDHLSRLTPLTAAEELALARTLAGLNDQTGAQIALQQFAAKHGESADLHRAQADVAAQAGNHSAARAALEKALRKAPDDRAVVMQLAQQHALSAEAAQKHSGIGQLLNLFEQSLHDRDPERRTHCFWTLAGMTIPAAAQRERFAQLIERMPWKTLERRVMQRFLQASIDPADPERLKLRDWVRGLIVSEADANAEERLLVTKILQRHGEDLLVLEWITFETGLQEAALCTARIDSLLTLRLWQQALDMVNAASAPLTDPLRAILRVQVHCMSHDHHDKAADSEASKLLGHALDAARKHDQQGNFIAIGRLAAQFGHPATAIRAYAEAMSEQFPSATFLVEPLLQAGRQAGVSARDIMLILQRRAHQEDWNRDLDHHLDYLGLVCGENIEIIQYKHRSIPADAPDQPQRALFYALACLRLRDHGALRQALTGIPRSHVWSIPQQTAFHAVCVTAGEASPLRQLPEAARLFAEEKRLLETGGTR